MRATMHRTWTALCAERNPRAVAWRLGVAMTIAAAGWACASIFLLMEPVS
jgi:hypothetical protein